MKIVKSLSLSCIMSSLTSIMPRGSSPIVGSSNIRMDGSCRIAAAIATRCFMPVEKSFVRLWAESDIFTSSSTVTERSRITSLSKPRNCPTYDRISRGVSCG